MDSSKSRTIRKPKGAIMASNRPIEGMDVVHSIEKVRTGNKGGHQDVPMDAVVINSAKLEA